MTLLKSLPPTAPALLPGRLEKWPTLSPGMTHYKLVPLCMYLVEHTHMQQCGLTGRRKQNSSYFPKVGLTFVPTFLTPCVQEGQRLGTSSPRTKVSKGALPGNTLREQGLQGWAWHFPLELSLEAFWRQTGQGNVLDVPAAKGPPVKEPERDEQWKPHLHARQDPEPAWAQGTSA